jgi:ATP-binding cassette subfamily B protein
VQDDEVLGKAYDARLMRRLLQYLRPYWRSVVAALITIVVGGAASLVQPYLIKVAIDQYIAARRLTGLDRLALVYLAVLVIAFVAEYAQTWTMQLTGQRIMFDLRMAIYRHLQRLDLRYYDRNPVGRLMTRVTSDVDVINDLFTSGVVTVFGDVFTLVGIMVMMLWMNWRLALVAFAVLPLIVLIAQWFRRNVRDSYRVVRGWIARINAFLQENITGMSTVQLFRREPLNFARFDEIDRKHRDANVESIFYYAVFYPAIEAVSTLATALIIWYGGGSVLRNTLTLGALVAFIQYSQRFFRPISDMSEKFNVLQSAMASSERIFRLLDEPVAIESPAQPKRRPAASADVRSASGGGGHIRFEDVWFAYNGEDWVLKGISFDVKPGERVGIVGATGSGKTTLINLLLRFYDVQRGRITIDGVDIRELDLADVRGLFSLVLQDVHLFSGTIADNIRLGNGSIDDDRIRRAARAAAGRLRRRRRRTRRDALGRPEAAALVRPRARLRPARPDPRRGDVERRHRNRAGDSRRAARADGRSHDDRHRAPVVDHPGHGQDPRAAQGPAARVGHAPGTAGAPRHLLQAVRATVPRGRRPRAVSVKREVGSQKLDASYFSAAANGRGRLASGAGSARLNIRSRRLGVVARGFQPSRSTFRWTGRRPNCNASLQLHM